MGEPVTTLDQVRLWLAALGPVVTAAGFWVVYEQLKIASKNYNLSAEAANRTADQVVETQAWRKAEFLANESKDFHADPAVVFCTAALDWYYRAICFPGDNHTRILIIQDEEIRNEIIERQQLNEKVKELDCVILTQALRIHDSKSFDNKEAKIRDIFDAFFYRLSRFQHMIT